MRHRKHVSPCDLAINSQGIGKIRKKLSLIFSRNFRIFSFPFRRPIFPGQLVDGKNEMTAHLFRKHKDKIPQWLAVRLINLWPPFLGAGIVIREADKDFRYMRIELKRSWYNINYVGVQFGGSIYAMVDPFYMLMLMHNLGDEFIVWDKAAHVNFLKPGKRSLFAEFNLEESLISEIKDKTQSNGKIVFDLTVRVTNSHGELIAQVVKTLYVRRKNPL